MSDIRDQVPEQFRMTDEERRRGLEHVAELRRLAAQRGTTPPAAVPPASDDF